MGQKRERRPVRVVAALAVSHGSCVDIGLTAGRYHSGALSSLTRRAACNSVIGRILMASQIERSENAVSQAADEAKKAARSAGKNLSESAGAAREQVAESLDSAAESLGQKTKSAPQSAKRYSRTAQDKLQGAADYVRDTDVRQMGKDAADAATTHPLASLLVLSAVVIGGGMVVAALARQSGRPSFAHDASFSQEGPRAMGLTSSATGIGRKGTETLSRIRDAAFSLALAKAVEAVDDIFPGFREHYEKA
jgi:multisubunit Na+/H+ antiporter MnhC subunit